MVMGTWSRGRRVAAVLGLVVLVLLAGTQLADLLFPAPKVGHWRDAGSRDRYRAAYQEVLATLPPPDVVRDVPTGFGTVRVLGWQGDAAGDPVLLVPGHSSGAPMWAENLPHWIGKRTVYAVDPLGDAGYSAQSLPLRTPADQAHWMAQTLNGLGISRAHVVGHSFGGANAAALALHHPDKVASLSLLEPVVVLSPLPKSIYLWSALLVLPVPQSWKNRALAEIGGTSVAEVGRRSPMSRMIDEASKGYETALPMPEEFSDEQWRSLRMPVRLDIGSESELAGGEGGADRARKLMPQATVTVWPGGTPSLPMDEHERIGAELLAFWAKA